MAINTQNIRVDLNPGRPIPVAYAHQNDNNREFTFTLYNNGVAYTPSGTTAKFGYKSPIVNGQYSVIAGNSMATGTVSGNTVTVTLPSAYTQVHGVGLLTMILTTSGNTLRPVNIKFVCQGSADGDDTILNASDWPDGLYDYMDNWLAENEPTEIANLKRDLINYNSLDVFQDIEWTAPQNWQGITITRNGRVLTISGTATGNGNYNLYLNSSGFPDGMNPGDKIIFDITSTATLPDLAVFFYINGSWEWAASRIKNGSHVTIPANATGIMVRFVVATGQSFSTDVTISGHCVASNRELDKKTNDILYRAVTGVDIGLFERGNISDGADSTSGENVRIRTTMISPMFDVQIQVDTSIYQNARFGIHTYNEDGSYIQDSGWLTAKTIKAGTICRLVFTSNYIDTSVQETIENIYNCFDINNASNENNKVIEFSNFNDITPLFEYGGLLNGVNDAFRANARARTINIIKCKKPIHVIYHSGSYGIHFFENGTFNADSGWQSRDYLIPAEQEFRLITTPNTLSADTDYYTLSDIVNTISFDIVDDNSFGMNPNIIFQCRNVDDTKYPPYSKWYIKAAAENQYDRVRVNIRVTTDGHYVLIHDNTINNEARNPNGTAIAETVNSNGQTYAYLNTFDWGIKYGEQYAGAGVPTLEEACKYASMYNMGLTIETSFDPTRSQVHEMAEIIFRYGLLENLIVIAGNSQILNQNYWKDINDYVSYQIAGDYDWLTAHIDDMNTYKTEKNTVYMGVLPWPSVSTAAIRTLAMDNSFRLYCGMIMNLNDLINVVGFDKGYTIIEANNVYMIKDTLREYADSQVDT